MNLFQKNLSGYTYIKYFLSYLIIITILILGFFFIIRSQLTSSYFQQRTKQAQTQLDNLADQLDDDILYLSQVDTSLSNDMELMMERYQVGNPSIYEAYQELREYAATTKLINTIVFMPRKSNIPLSTNLPVTYTNDIFYISDAAIKTVEFDPAPYLDSASAQLVFVSNEQVQFLLYFPAISSTSNCVFFYILDTNELQQMFKGLTTEEMPSIVLVDKNKRIVTGASASKLSPYLDSVPLEDGIYEMDAFTSLCVHTGVSQDFAMVSLLSHDFLNSQINSAFASSYLSLMLLVALGFLLIFLAMRITYLPLRRLTEKIIPNPDSKQGYLNQLEAAFSEAETQNQILKSKLDNYRISIQKSLLDSMLTSQYPDKTSVFPNIDQFFDQNFGRKIFVLKITAPGGALPRETIQDYLSNILPGNDSCVMLESETASAVFLINFTGNSLNKEEKIKRLCCELHEEKGYLSAISNGSASPMDIPSLYENAMHASSYWPQIPVAEFTSLPPASAAYTYPHDRLNRLSELLTENDFTSARQVIADLFRTTNLYITENGNLQNFFVQCILVDMLTIITNYMNLSYISFHDYSDLYFETLYFCRSCPYAEKAKEIQTNLEKLMYFCEQEISEKLVTSAPFIQLIEERYCQPDFSISVLADEFHVSIAHMSQLFKKEMNVNFSDYLWMLRLKKAKELLCTTNLSIDDVSIAVGYFNTSSFRRKFKQETGVTPSQFRAECGKNESLT